MASDNRLAQQERDFNSEMNFRWKLDSQGQLEGIVRNGPEDRHEQVSLWQLFLEASESGRGSPGQGQRCLLEFGMEGCGHLCCSSDLSSSLLSRDSYNCMFPFSLRLDVSANWKTCRDLKSSA